MIFVNFKTYEQGSGERALELVKALEEVANETQVKIIPVVQSADVKEAVQFSKLEIWVQHVDAVEFGAHTGSVLPEAVFEDGAIGTFLNHSEKKFSDFESLSNAHKRAVEVGLKTLVFASSLDELGNIAALSPTFVSYEPPEFIGSTTTSVISAQPDIILKAVEIAKTHNLPLIVGAGIHSTGDVKKSMELGAAGIAIATNVVKAEDPKKALINLIEGFK
ncbi:MAG: triose-phosphate isomerase [bacterium]|nr:triose-phosphate isomerase [bacterium]